MNTGAKIYLSEQELQLACNSEWILTKQKITGKVYELLGNLSEDIKIAATEARDWLPAQVITSTAKIYKGENYLQLPYVLLDYPRCFDKADIFAIRTMFWWGNYFSTALLLEGKYKALFQEAIMKNISRLPQNFYLYTGADKWQHHFSNENCCYINSKSKEDLDKIITEKEFIKIAINYPLQKWNDIPALLNADIKLLLDVLKN